MRRILFIAIGILAADGAMAQPATPTIEVALSSFKFTPSTITLRHGQAYTVHIVNQSSGGHNFVARRFFEAADVTGADRPKIVKGGVDLDGGGQVEIHLVAPAAGRYEAHCSHFMHSSFGMKGEIVVE